MEAAGEDSKISRREDRQRCGDEHAEMATRDELRTRRGEVRHRQRHDDLQPREP
jgi:hypothetical protein